MQIHSFGSNKHFKKCEHARYTAKQQKSKVWLKPDSLIYKQLVAIVLDTRILKLLPKLTKFCHTGNLEVFHALVTKYCPKRQHFSYKGMLTRMQLAVLDHNANVGRKQAKVKSGKRKGTLRYSQVFTKRRKTWVIKPIKEPKSYIFLDKMVERVVESRASKENSLPVIEVPNLPKNIASKPKPDKLEAIENHRSRMQLGKK